MLDHLKSKSILLGSQSPRRKELLASLNIQFSIMPIAIKEDFPSHLNSLDVASFLAKKKADNYNPSPKEILITADTVVIHQDKILNKPHNKLEAQQMLKQLSDGYHHVVTGVCIKTIDKQIECSELTKVYFKPLSDKEIHYYIDHYHPMDKAGAYGIQEWIGKIAIYKIEGCYYNVMGLPLTKLYNNLINL